MSDNVQSNVTRPEIGLDMVKKSNALINRIGKTSLMSEKVFLDAVTNIRLMGGSEALPTPIRDAVDEIKNSTGISYDSGYVTILSNPDLKGVVASDSWYYYKQIDALMNGYEFINSWNILYLDKRFSSIIGVIMSAAYDRKSGSIFIKWNPDAIPMLLNLTKNYTALPRDIMRGFKNIHSFSIYQMLRSGLCLNEGIDSKRGNTPAEEYKLEYSLSEFKFLTRVIDVDLTARNETSKKIITALMNKDYQAAEAATTPSYISASYRELKREVLNKAFLEINGFTNEGFDDESNVDAYNEMCTKTHKTDLHFRFKPIRNGLGGKVNGIELYVRWDNGNRPSEQIPEKSENIKPDSADRTPEEDNNKIEFLKKIQSLVKESLTQASLKAIAETSDWDFTKVEMAYKHAQNSKSQIDNLAGFMISAIREEYDNPVAGDKKDKPVRASHSGAKTVHNYAEHEYNQSQMSAIEQAWRMKHRKA